MHELNLWLSVTIDMSSIIITFFNLFDRFGNFSNIDCGRICEFLKMVHQVLQFVSKIFRICYPHVKLFNLLLLALSHEIFSCLDFSFGFLIFVKCFETLLGLGDLLLLLLLRFCDLGLLKEPLSEEVNWIGGLSFLSHSHCLGNDKTNLILLEILSIPDAGL